MTKRTREPQKTVSEQLGRNAGRFRSVLSLGCARYGPFRKTVTSLSERTNGTECASTSFTPLLALTNTCAVREKTPSRKLWRLRCVSVFVRG